MENEQIKSDVELLKIFAMDWVARLQNVKIQIDEVKGVAAVQGTKCGKVFSFINQKFLLCQLSK